ncbi:hypothetical protein C1H46_033166 [Malus baccata]|uniref:Uncharacterized protein n=1 Tax=Malus baccata TaxID=106549 RepID=A0A540L492_MALBA|nr:hypothetical protein C1H46_033166 [Malus baccata]
MNDDMLVALDEGCPKEFEDREDNWVWLCSHFQEPGYVSGLKFSEINAFSDIYVQPGDKLVESFHATMMEKRQLVLQEFASQLPPETPLEFVDPLEDAGFQILTEIFDQTLGRRLGTYCRGWGMPGGGNLEPFHHLNQRALSQSGIGLPDLRPSLTFKPFQPEHAHNSTSSTSKPVPNLETF